MENIILTIFPINFEKYDYSVFPKKKSQKIHKYINTIHI